MAQSTDLTPVPTGGLPPLIDGNGVVEGTAVPDREVGAAAPEPVPKHTLSGQAKAAIVVRFLLNEGADLPLEELPEDLQARLAAQMGRMGLVDRTTLAAVAREFAETLDGVGLAFQGGLPGALDVLDGRISPQTARRLRKEAGVRQIGDPWARLRALSVEDLAPIVAAESTEVAAVLLSKLDVEKAANLLGHLPGPLARRVAYAVSQTAAVTPEAVDRIGLSLASQLELKPETAFEEAPEDRLGAILNQSASNTREDMLHALDEADEPFASAVRQRIFTFAHIPARVAPGDVAKILKEVETDKLVMALAAATAEADAAAAEHILSNISSRMAANLREEAADLGVVRGRDGENAMTSVVAAIRRLEVAGDIRLIVPESEEEA